MKINPLEVLGIGGRIIEAKIKRKEAEINARTEATTRLVKADSGWEGLAAQNAMNSNLDELWTVVLIIPLILSFIGMDELVKAGFEGLENVPSWYQWAVLASVSFAFARKQLPSLGEFLKRSVNKN